MTCCQRRAEKKEACEDNRGRNYNEERLFPHDILRDDAQFGIGHREGRIGGKRIAVLLLLECDVIAPSAGMVIVKGVVSGFP